MKYFLRFLLFTFIMSSCQARDRAEQQTMPDHSLWTELLEAHVDSQGMVNYKGMIRDSLKLNAYLDQLSAGVPGSDAAESDKLAFWINAYNAFTVKLITQNYPIGSIKDLNPVLSVPTVRTIWTKEWFEMGGEPMSLDHIEHAILRKQFNEPRIHFAINCASISCPEMRNEAFTGKNIDQQLSEQAQRFINDPIRNDIRDPQNPQLSRIFSWFKGDFTQNGSLQEFINMFAETPVTDDISFLDYNWALNDSKSGN